MAVHDPCQQMTIPLTPFEITLPAEAATVADLMNRMAERFRVPPERVHMKGSVDGKRPLERLLYVENGEYWYYGGRGVDRWMTISGSASATDVYPVEGLLGVDILPH